MSNESARDERILVHSRARRIGAPGGIRAAVLPAEGEAAGRGEGALHG